MLVALNSSDNTRRNTVRLSKIVLAALALAACGPVGGIAQTPGGPPNLGAKAPEASLPFTMTEVAKFNLPWRIAFLPDSRMLVTEKVGPVWLVDPAGKKVQIANTPSVAYRGQNGMLGVFVSPTYRTDNSIYLTYSEPGDVEGASGLVMARAKLVTEEGFARLENLQVLWRQMPKGMGGQSGAQIAFAPDGKSLFLAVGDRQRMTPAQDPNSELGKVLHLTLDGKPAAGNPSAGKTGTKTVTLIAPPRDTEVAKTAPVVASYTYPGANLAPSETWSSGHRTNYGMAFAPDGRLWEVEHGPKGGDELNLILPGKNYGWPEVCYCANYNDVPVPQHDTRPEFEKPKLYWNPIIAPGNIMFYKGAMFPQWNGNALITGMASKTLNRVIIDGDKATAAERWDMGKRMRDIEVAPDGALWAIEDANPGSLMRITPK
jgi:glucose/arabinose dehydrogenase